jgi:TetR/AcrR family transcriptional repressor of mexJK operon
MAAPARKEDPSRTPSTKRELIVAAGRKLFMEAGYGATSMDAIAHEAGVSKRTVYDYFRNKEALFAAIIGDFCHQMIGPGPDDPIPDGPPEQVLSELGRNIVFCVAQPGALDVFRVILAESPKFPELGDLFWKAGPEHVKRYLSRYLEKLDRDGTLSVPDPDLAALQFVGMVKWPIDIPLMFGIGEPPGEVELNRTIDQAVATFLDGLRPRER